MHLVKEAKNIWHFPTWYPNPQNWTLGSFVKKQILLASTFSLQTVIYVTGNKKTADGLTMNIIESNNLLELYVSFTPSPSKITTLRRKNKAYKLAIEKLYELGLKPDFVHSHSISFASYFAKKTAKKHQVKWALSEHWSGFLPASNGFQKMPYIKRKIWINHSQKTDYMVCVSKILESSMINFGLGNNNYQIIPNVVEGDLNIDNNNEEFIFLNVSDMVDSVKNISGLIKAFETVWQDNKAVRLWLVGTGPDEKKLTDLIKNLPSKDAIQHFGRLKPEEVIKLYPKVSATIINSNYETFSVVAAESLYCGRPIISTKCGGPEEFATENEGIFIDINRPDQLKNAMVLLMKNYTNYEPKELHEHIKNQFSNKIIINKLKDLYQV